MQNWKPLWTIWRITWKTAARLPAHVLDMNTKFAIEKHSSMKNNYTYSTSLQFLNFISWWNIEKREARYRKALTQMRIAEWTTSGWKTILRWNLKACGKWNWNALSVKVSIRKCDILLFNSCGLHFEIAFWGRENWFP